ncbi:hypothetical protein SNEBB_006384 [Seison nebaliae]|nr:hypothetical protein SNEBB_006384 [Seison nebaliae]
MEPNKRDWNKNFEKALTNRESWWRAYVRETPLPNRYEIPSSIQQFLSRTDARSSFKSDGRRRAPYPHHQQTGSTLLPGAYYIERSGDKADLTHRLLKCNSSYAFRSISRPTTINTIHNVSPNQYDLSNHQSISSTKATRSFANFRSETQRFPIQNFRPKSGPGPGFYEPLKKKNPQTITSVFKSPSDRFPKIKLKYSTPAPGSYEPIRYNGDEKRLRKLLEQQTIMFSIKN